MMIQSIDKGRTMTTVVVTGILGPAGAPLDKEVLAFARLAAYEPAECGFGSHLHYHDLDESGASATVVLYTD